MKPNNTKTQTLLSCVLYFLCCFSFANTADKPNIILVFMDNFGWGEPGFNGGGIILGNDRPTDGSIELGYKIVG